MTGTTGVGPTADVRRSLHRLSRRVGPPAALLLAVVLVSTMVAVTSGPDEAASTAAAREQATAHGANAGGGVAPAQTVAPGEPGSPIQPVAVAGREGAAVGVARSGVACTEGARQIPWSHYGPMCTPAFEGDNGGATAPGVTRDTITISYRLVNTAQQQTLSALVGDGMPVDGTYIRDLETYAALFNANFELYGRRVVIEPFQAQGDWLLEYMGRGQEQAQADAVSARQLGAFADITFPVSASPFYAQALADQEVIGWGPVFMPQSWYERLSPFQYHIAPSGSKWAALVSNLICQRMRDLPAVFAGDEAMTDDERVFGLATVAIPSFLQVADELEDLLASCEVEIARRVDYPMDVGAFQHNASNLAAQMREAGVATLICLCDGLFPIFLSKAATDQSYRPEWIALGVFDAFPQLADQSQFENAMSQGPAFRPRESSEAFAAYELARPGSEPADVYTAVGYYTLLHVFSALQAAGPDLTPATFQRGMFSLPPSLPGGGWGEWSFGPGAYTPNAALSVVYWDPDRLSSNGKRGTWVPCEGDTAFPLDRAEGWGPAGTQIGCFGR